jgi:hypothetical protein
VSDLKYIKRWIGLVQIGCIIIVCIDVMINAPCTLTQRFFKVGSIFYIRIERSSE